MIYLYVHCTCMYTAILVICIHVHAVCMAMPNTQGSELMEHFERSMGCIEIQGKSGRIERVYFEVKESRLKQWKETQIQVATCVLRELGHSGIREQACMCRCCTRCVLHDHVI